MLFIVTQAGRWSAKHHAPQVAARWALQALTLVFLTHCANVWRQALTLL